MQRSPKYKIQSLNVQIWTGLLTWIDFNQSM